ncbi:putative extracellular nuclease [Corynebacterium epidermidicanis]|uniref:Putative extracellular nuclease n=2 Tax=Corynebacterium epidermidicanis TaxID=1050174 RepID=A0A0G3GWL8_9CORY|nr:putative extracellular nuclease [Corynebacterium epidermidicanis]
MLAMLVATATVAALPVPAALASPDGSDLVINEVFGGGGNSGAPYTNDFVELYNPTDQAISLAGYEVAYYSAKGGPGGKTQLTGNVAPRSHFLISMSGGTNGVALPTPDFTGTLALGGTGGTVKLLKAGADLDVVGWGAATIFESQAAAGTANTTSVQRTSAGVDTDNNAADFTAGSPTPQNSGTTPGETTTPGTTSPTTSAPTTTAQPSVEPGAVIPIADIQGTGSASPMVGKSVTTRGWVTSSYPEGGFNGFHLQTGGTGKTEKQAGQASDGIFIYAGKGTSLPSIGDCVTVSGTVSEYGKAGTSITQLSSPTVTSVDKAQCGEEVTPVAVTQLAADPNLREAYEGMLVQPTGAHTVTNNYALNTYGSVDLALGDKPYYQGTDVFPPSTDPNSDVQKLMAQQAAEVITLDDGRSADYFKTDKNTPLPYLAQDGGKTIKSLRTGDGVRFQHPVILDQRFNTWNFQPTQPITGNTAGTDLPITWEDSRVKVANVPDTVAGNYSLASFNVLNYFTTLGQNKPGCKAYNDKDGHPVAANGCTVRGAYSEKAFQDQQAKIVAAINKLNVSVLGLEEIENTATVTDSQKDRDTALAYLVSQLNAAGGNWDYVRSPAKVPSSEDYIRVAFIYQKDKVAPKGESIIFDAPEFTGTARQPLAQEFSSVANPEATFVTIVNHFKSKGSVAKGDGDTGDGQGNNANLRVQQAKALLRELSNQKQWQNTPTFIVGDLNSYSKETPVTTLIDGGFANLGEGRADASPSYQFGGRLGSLDHALANEAAAKLVQDAKVWDINSDESVAFEYSRRNYNAVDFYQPDFFRSSDHDPIKVGFNLPETTTSAPTTPETTTPEVTSPATSTEPTSEPVPTVTTAVTTTLEPTTVTETLAPETITTTAEPVTTTAVSTQVTTQVSTVTADPVTVTADPVTVTADPVTVTAAPVTTTVNGTPVTVTADPVTTTVTAAPVTVTPAPVTTTVNGTPITVTAAPVTTTAAPVTVTETATVTPAPVTTTVTTTGTATVTVTPTNPETPKPGKKPVSNGSSAGSFLGVLFGIGTIFGLGNFLLQRFAPQLFAQAQAQFMAFFARFMRF